MRHLGLTLYLHVAKKEYLLKRFALDTSSILSKSQPCLRREVAFVLLWPKVHNPNQITKKHQMNSK